MNRGVLYALGAYGLWGLVPLYFKLLTPINSLEVLAWRVLCSVAFVGLLLAAKRHWGWLTLVGRQPRVWKMAAGSAVLIAVNWYVYIWAVTHDRVVETALGYFINPLVNVLAGALWLHERLRRLQWLAVALAAAGVAWITWHHGSLPWIALVLPLSFAGYGLLRRSAPLGALEGLALESLLLAPVAAGGLALAQFNGVALDVAEASPALRWCLLASGPITGIPLLLFAAAARRLPFSTLGMLQYLGPTLALLVGVWVYHEPFSGARAQGFVLIWLACAVFSAEAWRQHRHAMTPPTSLALATEKTRNPGAA